VQQTGSSSTFEWSTVADADFYEVEYSADSSFQNASAITQDSTEQTSYLAPATSGVIYWRVRAVVGANHGLWSAVDDSGPKVTVNPPATIQFEVSRQNVPAGIGSLL